MKLFATSRNPKQFTPLQFSSKHDVEIIYPQLDIANLDSIRALEQQLKQHGDHVDVLINNAGINLDARYGPETAKQTLDTNYFGVLEVCYTLLL